jgi:hypothetical protein
VLAATLWSLTLATVLGLVGFALLSGGPVFGVVSGIVFKLSFATVGALVAARQPRNPIGWILSGMGLVFGMAQIGNAWADYTLTRHPGALSSVAYGVWIQNWAILAAFTPIVLVVLLFPNGRPLTRRWRPVVALAALSIVVLLFSVSFAPRLLSESNYPRTPNPLAIPGLDGAAPLLENGGVIIFALTLLAGIISAALRFRRASGVERQQLKWLAWACSAQPLAVALLIVVDLPAVADHPGLAPAIKACIVLTLTLVPVAAGIAMLRHRLYDIDRLINRTVVYATLTALLAAGYLLGVMLLQRLLDPLTGGSNLAVAGSTLAVAAMARPARGHIQALVDQRFNRRRYDAAGAIDSFSARLRTQLDLDALAAELCGVAHEAMQPTHVSLWLRDPGQRRLTGSRP